MSKVAVSVVALVVFTAYTVFVAVNHSLFGFFAELTQGGLPLQVFVDLVVAAACFWVAAVPDARSRGITVWPYIVLTPFVGSIALLGYFVHRSLRQRQDGAPDSGLIQEVRR
jgi:hypothetical protein